MKNILSDLAYDITQLIKGSGRVILMYDEDGNRTYDQREASKIFAYPDKMMIMITDDGIDSTVDVALSDSTDVIELQDFINTLRHLTTNYNVLFNIQKYGKEIEPKDFANYGPTDVSECLDYYNLERVDELFKGDSDVEITYEDDIYQFTIDGTGYFVELQGSSNTDIVFGIINGDWNDRYEPTEIGKNQFLILNTVLKCVDMILKNNTSNYYHFSGSLSNGLSKLYSIMFDKLKNKVSNYGYMPISTSHYSYNSYNDEWEYDPRQNYWYFINTNTTEGVDLVNRAKEQNLPFANQLIESRIDELFKSDSDVEITHITDNRYIFIIDGLTYIVDREDNGEIVFSVRKNGSRGTTTPVKNNKNQFIVLNTVVSIVKEMVNDNPYDITYFSGDNANGLAKVYSAMAKVLKKDLPDGFTLLIPEPKIKWGYNGWMRSSFDNSPQYYYIVPDTDKGLDMLDSYQEFVSGNVNEASLSDYKTIKNNDWGLPVNLIEWLKGKGFKMIGEGHYSYIFSSESEDFVVKVNNGERMDKGYLEFVEFCRQNKGNPHLPKIGTVKKYENWYIVFIEKLEEFEELGGYSKLKLVVDIKDEADNWKTSITGDIVKQVKDCGKLLKQIKYLGDDDFHVDNLMKRGDTLVITDPLI